MNGCSKTSEFRSLPLHLHSSWFKFPQLNLANVSQPVQYSVKNSMLEEAHIKQTTLAGRHAHTGGREGDCIDHISTRQQVYKSRKRKKKKEK